MTAANRPGLPALNYRVGTHASFLEAMKQRLASLSVEVPAGDGGQNTPTTVYPLENLNARATDDPAIAVLDAWALVADVLTFYQERIANEGYLRTASERRSILELARLVGYSLRPGVASTVYLAYTIDEDRTVDPPKEVQTSIPAGARSQSVPGPGELPQSFETAEDLDARSTWNNLQVRLTQPQTKQSITGNQRLRVYLKGTATYLKANDALLITETDPPTRDDLFRVTEVLPDAAKDRTVVTVAPWPPTTAADAPRAIEERMAAPSGPAAPRVTEAKRAVVSGSAIPPHATEETRIDLSAPSSPPHAPEGMRRDASGSIITTRAYIGTLIGPHIALAPSVPPANAARLPQKITTSLDTRSDTSLRLAPFLRPELTYNLVRVLSNATPPERSALTVYAFRVKATRFGSNAPLTADLTEWPIAAADQDPAHVDLDSTYDQIAAEAPGKPSWVICDHGPTVGQPPSISSVKQVRSGFARADYGFSGKITRLMLENPASDLKAPSGLNVIRETVIYAQSEQLPLADAPIAKDLRGDDPIELFELYSGLEPGRWLIVSGERRDISINGRVVPGVYASELAMLDTVTHRAKDELDTVHTFITLAEPLAYRYKRDTVRIFGNVAKATQGETRTEVLGSGDSSTALQRFTLRQPPLTYVPASNPTGVSSTLQVRVNDVLWHEADSLADLLPTDRKFITRTDDEGKTTVVFGDGQEGARLPTGQQNVTAVYRSGIGKAGNVNAEQITLLSTRPLGVKSVTNPLGASGGADRESRDQARTNAPVGVMALDRLVSVQDYGDFSRTFAGIGKASALHVSDGRRWIVHVTIVGTDNIPISESSDVYRNLVDALTTYGDPQLPIQVARRELLVLVVSANVRVLPDYLWESVKPKIVAAMSETFGFERRDLGQPVYFSEVVSAIQNVAGVAYVDLDVLDSISEDNLGEMSVPKKLAAKAQPNRRVDANVAALSKDGTISPAQLLVLLPNVPGTLILNGI